MTAMKTTLGSLVLVLAFAACAVAQPAAPRPPEPSPAPQAPGDSGTERVTMPFSDPARPGIVDISMVTGNIVVRGANRRDVQIEARSTSGRAPRRTRADAEPPPPGLRRLTQNSPFTVAEDKNTISIDVNSPMRGMDFTIEVPLRTNLALETVSGSITVEGVEGELEVDAVNGSVLLTNVAGSVVAHSVNGKVTATVARATPQKPMAFTSLNGAVDVTLPATVKANLKLRSDQGDVYTDFDLQLRQESSNGNPSPVSRNGRARAVVEIDNSIYGSINGGGPDFEMRTFNGNVYVRKGK